MIENLIVMAEQRLEHCSDRIDAIEHEREQLLHEKRLLERLIASASPAFLAEEGS